MTTEINLADVIPFDRGRRARQRGRCGSIHPMFPHVPCQRPRAHGERYEHGSHGWDGAGRKGVLYWTSDDRPVRFVADESQLGRAPTDPEGATRP